MAKRTDPRTSPTSTDRGTAGERPRRRRTTSPVPGGSLEPSHREIAERAYYLYLARGAEPGRDFDDWVQAERELRRERRR